MKENLSCFVAMITLATLLAGAENQFVGTWKMNPERSSNTGHTVTYSKTADAIKSSGSGMEYTFKMDGQEYPLPYPDCKVAWTQIDDHTWRARIKFKGEAESASTMELSADGKRLIRKGVVKKPNGEEYTNDSVLERVSGGSGLMGTWRTIAVKAGSPDAFKIEMEGTDGIKMSAPDFQFSLSAKFDGKEYPMSGPTVPSGMTAALKRIDERTIEETDRIGRGVLSVDIMNLSPDGKTLTITSRNPNTKDPATVSVYERQ